MRAAELGRRLLGQRLVRLLLWMCIAHAHFPAATDTPQRVTQNGDDHMHYLFDEAARRSIVEYGQVPHWNPYYCGGIGGIANSESTILAPDFLLRVFFGTGPGRRLAFLLFVMLGLEGMFLLARQYEVSPLAAVIAGVIFACSGSYTHHLDRGWLNMLPFELMPWVWLGFERGLRQWRWRLVGGAFLAWIALCGGTYTLPYTVLLVGVLTFARMQHFARRAAPPGTLHWSIPLKTAATIGGVGLGLAAVKLLPVLAEIGNVPPVLTVYGYGLVDLLGYLALRPEGSGIPWSFAYIGFLPLLLAPLALGTGRRGIGLLLGAIFFLTLATGDFAPVAPYTLLSHVPIFGKLRFPFRYLVVVALFLALATGVGLSFLGRLRRLGILSGLLGIVAAGMVVQTTAIRPGQVHTRSAPASAELDFVQMRGNRWDAHIWAPMNVGSLTCVAGMSVTQSSALRPDLPKEEYPLDPTKAEVRRLRWTPNRIELQVEAKEPSTVIVNQNHAAGWTTDRGEIVSHEGLLALRLPAGEHRVALEYTSPLWFVGLSVSLLLLGFLLGVFLQVVLRKRSSAEMT